MATPDYTCSTAADCTEKNVGNCCGQYNACVNTAFVPDLEAVKAACSGMASACGWSDINYCVCTAGRCEGQQGQPTQPTQPMQAVWPASDFTLWPAVRVVAIIYNGLVLLLSSALSGLVIGRCGDPFRSVLLSAAALKWVRGGPKGRVSWLQNFGLRFFRV